MARYLVENVSSGVVLGIYEGETAEDAFRALLRDDRTEKEPGRDLAATVVPLAVVALKNGRDIRAVCELSDEQIAEMVAPQSPWVAMMDDGIRSLVQGWSTSPRKLIEDYAAIHLLCYEGQPLTIG